MLFRKARSGHCTNWRDRPRNARCRASRPASSAAGGRRRRAARSRGNRRRTPRRRNSAARPARRGASQRRDHQPVPAHEHLVVAAGTHALRSRGQQFRAVTGKLRNQLRRVAVEHLGACGNRLGQVQDVMAFEVAAGGNIVDLAEGRRGRGRARLRFPPASRRRTCPPRLRYRRPLRLVSAVRVRHVAEHVISVSRTTRR